MPTKAPRQGKFLSDLETLAAVASGIIAEPMSGLGGILASSLANDSDKGVQAIENIRNAMTYQPRSQGARENLQDISHAMGPVGDAMANLNKKFGDTAYDITGSPLVAAGATAVPEAIMSLPFMRGAKGAANYPDVPSNFKQSGMLAGPKAVGADLAALEKAKALKAQGADRAATRQQTGWHEQAPGQWVYEIPDTGFKMKDPTARTMGGAFEHPEAYKAYPELADMPFSTDALPGTVQGQYMPKSSGEYGVTAIPGKNLQSNALHEAFGHGVQDIEGRVGGSNPRQADNMRRLKIQELEGQIASGRKSPEYKQRLTDARAELLGGQDYSKLGAMEGARLQSQARDMAQESSGLSDMMKSRTEMDEASPLALYERDWGEAEARLIQQRLAGIEHLRGQGMPDAEIDALLRKSPIEYDRPTESLIDVQGELDRMLGTDTPAGPSLAQNPLAQDILKSIDETGGATVDVATGKTPKGGYMVAKYPNTNTGANAIMKGANVDDLDAYMKANAPELSEQGTYLGAWKNDGDLYVEPSKNITDYDEAMKFGEGTGQLAGYDMNQWPEFEAALSKRTGPGFSMNREFPIVPDRAAAETARRQQAVNWLFNR